MAGTPAFDIAVREWVVAHQAPALVTFFIWVSRIGATRNMYGLALAGAAYLWYRGQRPGAVGVILATVGAIALFEGLKRLIGRARPPGLGYVFEGNTYSFPSAHSTASAAVCCALAYVFWREGIINRTVALWVGIGTPVLVGMSRVYLDMHWATDVLGGWTAGLLVAALFLVPYHRSRRRFTSNGESTSRTSPSSI